MGFTLNYGALLSGRRAIVSGDALGIGREVAALFKSCGAGVMRIAGGGDGAIPADLADARSLGEAFERARNELGGVDLLVNVAELAAPGGADGIGADALRALMGKSYLCAFRLTRDALPSMIENRRGDIVNITPDVGAFYGKRGTAAIAACAGAIQAFTRCVAMDYIRYHVRANCVHVPMDGLPRKRPLLGAPDASDAANAALWYACDLSRYVVGDSAFADGGQRYYARAGGGFA